MSSPQLVICEKINSELLEGVKELWENSLFFDFTLKVEDESIPVHKVILAACSGYFRAMFNSSMKESTQTSVELKGLTANAVKSMIHYFCTGIIQFPADTLEDVLSAAHYLQIHSIVDFCSDILLKDMTWESVSYVQNFARLYGLDDVEKKVEQFMLKNFSQMPSEVVGAIGNQVFKLTASNSLFVNSEYALFEKLLLFKPTLSKDEFDKVLSHVRFPLMSKDELEKVSSTGVMTTRSSHLMDEAWEYHKDVMRQPLLQTERTQVRSEKVAMVVADKNFIDAVYEDQPHEKIETIEPISVENIMNGCFIQEIVSMDNFLYVCQKKHVSNGTDYLGLFRYDPRFNLWQEMRPLLETDRRWFSLVACGKQIFVIKGGWPRTLQIYNIQTNQWRFGAEVNYNAQHRAGVAFEDKVFVSGGEQFDARVGENVSVDTFSCYDPENDTWQLKAPMNKARSRHQSVMFDGKLFVFAGTNGEISLFSVECYSPDINQWTIFQNALPHRIDGVCSNGSDIYILKRDELADEAIPDTTTVSFKKFNMETKRTEGERFTVKVEKNDILFRFNRGFMCSTLMLPLKLK